MGSPASSSSAQLLLLFLVAYFLFCSSLDAPPHSIAAAAEDPRPPVSFSFNFSDTSSYRSEDLKFEGDATVHGKMVDLTCNSYDQTINGCTGRMSYGHPVPFYDKTTGEVASFSTRFTFAINSETMINKGDGMAFFLACYPSSMPPDSGGGYLGLIGRDERTAYDAARFVAVEFDTYANPWDPNGTSSDDHIGIDISSVQDLINTTSLTDFTLSGNMTASITFDNSTRMLVASLEFADNRSIGTVKVSTKLPNPDTLLPPEVAVGFSAATGASIELHQILSWSFNSTLPAPLHKGMHACLNILPHEQAIYLF